MSDTGTSKSARNDVNHPLKREGEPVVCENRVNKERHVRVHRGSHFPSVALMRVVELQLLVGHSQMLCSCLSLHLLSSTFLVLPLKLVWNLRTWDQPTQFLSYHPVIHPVFQLIGLFSSYSWRV